MLLIAADTSGKHGSIALASVSDNGTCTVIETVTLDGGAFSSQLVPQIAALLLKNGFDRKDIGGFAAVAGPGSFTGLRVGLAAIKALGEALQKPIAAVSMLEAIAVAGGFPGKSMAALDAGRQQVYVGEYDIVSDGTRRIEECLLTRDEFLNGAAGANVVTSDSEMAALARSSAAAVRIIAAPRADSIAQLGWKKILSGETMTSAALEANYIGHADAEIFSRSRSR